MDEARKPTALIVGCGYVGQRLAQALLPTHRVAGTVRSQTSRAAVRALGIDNALLDLDNAQSLKHLPPEYTDAAALFYLTPPPAHGLSDTRLDRFLRLIDKPPTLFVYMSTTGVYGSTDGREVDESDRINPQTERAQRRASAEEMTRVWCHELQVRRVVLRVPGIYGPDRLPLERLRRGEPVIRLDEATVSNRIHVDDLVNVCLAVARNAEARGVFNVTDGNSVSATEFVLRVAAMSGLPPPPQISLEEARLTLSPQRLSFLEESRRVSNRRLLSELAVKLKYASLDAGIRASLATRDSSSQAAPQSANSPQ